MAENEQTKVCPLCAETIKAAAKVCPFCRASQRRWPFLTVHDLIMILTVLFAFAASALLFHLMDHGRTFSPKRDHLEVLHSWMAVQMTEWGTRWSTNVVVEGIMTNGSPYAWKVGDLGELEVRFFGPDGKITDTDTISGDEFTILPHSHHSFRFYLDRKSIPEHASYKIYVRLAKDPKGR